LAGVFVNGRLPELNDLRASATSAGTVTAAVNASKLSANTIFFHMLLDSF